ncbi:hypothetical protein SAMN05444673_6874 [Bacillus sp. OV166]|nr:hypothetical protein SAMN05444673_6874 [Bacillus sp. OV166]
MDIWSLKLGSRALFAQKFFAVAKAPLSKKLLCPLTDLIAFLASSRKGSGVLPAGSLESLRCFTIRKAKGKNKQQKQPFRLLSFCPLFS